ncbi:MULTISPECIES: AraC family transcriptional regulator [unclassified Pseudomonas]|uniref:AraC family transcriptional regulator n=1 Tax=unclassified Pseudomonas TaxID=196821 RepID=UPI0025D427C8|nr:MULTISPECIES: AraC family transcriptional regulator [unclassified Pseudomonas]
MPTVIPSLAHFMIDALRSTGLDIDRFCQAVGLQVHELDVDEAWIPRVKLYRLYKLAADLSHDPDIGLRSTTQTGPGIFDVVGYVMMSSDTLQTALERLVHFVALLDTSIAISLHAEGDQHRLGCHFLDGNKVPRQYGDASVAMMFGLCRMLVGPSLQLRGIGLMHAAPPDISVYEHTFHCSAQFGEHCYSILLDNADLARPLASANKQLAPLHELVAEMHLSTRRYFSVPGEVRKMILESLSEGIPPIEDLAKKMCVSKRTLQRLLQQAGHPYKELVNDIRRSQAEFYLGNTQCTLQEAAYRVGFRELSSFYRACHQWFGMPPARYRLKLQGSASTPAEVTSSARLAEDCSITAGE